MIQNGFFLYVGYSFGINYEQYSNMRKNLKCGTVKNPVCRMWESVICFSVDGEQGFPQSHSWLYIFSPVSLSLQG